MTKVFVLDSYAILALLSREAGSERVSDVLRQVQVGEVRALMTWVNVGEVAYIVERRWGKGRLYQVLGTLEATKIEVVPVGRELALAAADIKAKHPLAYADAFAPALAMSLQATLMTGDREFEILGESVPIQWIAEQA